MFRRERIWRIAVLALALLWTASPGWAAARARQGEPPGWSRLWEKALIWLVGGQSSAAPAGQPGHEKSSSSIDPNGSPHYSAGIDPDGSLDYSAGIDPNGSH